MMFQSHSNSHLWGSVKRQIRLSYICPHSSVGQSICLLSKGSLVQIQLGIPLSTSHWGYVLKLVMYVAKPSRSRVFGIGVLVNKQMVKYKHWLAGKTATYLGVIQLVECMLWEHDAVSSSLTTQTINLSSECGYWWHHRVTGYGLRVVS